MDQATKRMVAYSEKSRAQQEQKIALYEYQADLLKKRIAQYKITFSAKPYNHVRRLN